MYTGGYKSLGEVEIPQPCGLSHKILREHLTQQSVQILHLAIRSRVIWRGGSVLGLHELQIVSDSARQQVWAVVRYQLRWRTVVREDTVV